MQIRDWAYIPYTQPRSIRVSVHVNCQMLNVLLEYTCTYVICIAQFFDGGSIDGFDAYLAICQIFPFNILKFHS